MTNARRADEAADLYARFRLAEQRSFYQRRCDEFGRARNQARISATVLLVCASSAGALGGADVLGLRRWWAVAATILSAAAAALTAYEATYGFDRLAREYDNTASSLARIEARLVDDARAGAHRSTALRSLVQGVEGQLTGEIERWISHSAAATIPDQPIDLHDARTDAVSQPPPAAAR